jgi:hypothetical protein
MKGMEEPDFIPYMANKQKLPYNRKYMAKLLITKYCIPVCLP